METEARHSSHARVGGRLDSLDGLRAIAILGILLYHLKLPFAPGGSFGVVVFFVLSGYLLTSSMMRMRSRDGGISVPRIILNRLKRIWPSMAVMIVVVTALCTVFNHVLLTKVRADIGPALGYSLNWAYILRGGSYFASLGTPSPLLHLWYVGVSEQFCLVWLLLGSFLLSRGRKTAAKVALGLAAVSALLMVILYSPDTDPTRVYYGLDTRAFALLAGCALACVWPVWRNAPLTGMDVHGNELSPAPWVSPVAIAGSCVSLVALVAGMVLVSDENPLVFRGGMVLLTCMSVLLIAGCLLRTGPVHSLLSLPPFVAIGQRSYAIYLWHYPFICLFDAQLAVTSVPIKILAIALSLVLAELSWRLLEQGTIFELPGLGGKAAGAHAGPVHAYESDAREFPISNDRGNHNRFSRNNPANALPPWASLAGVMGTVVLCGIVGAWGLINIPDESIVPQEAIVSTGDSADHAIDVSQLTPRPVEIVSEGSAEQPAEGSVAGSAEQTEQPTEPVQDTPERPAIQIGSFPRIAGELARNAADNAHKRILLSIFPPDNVSQIFGAPADTSQGKLSPLLIGDSVPGDTNLAGLFPDGLVDTYIGRRPDQALDVFREYKSQGVVGKFVIFAAFSNTTPMMETLEEIIAEAGPDTILYFVGVVEPEGFMDQANINLKDCASRYENVRYVDWPTICAGHESEYLWGDYTHLTPDGAVVYTQMIARAVVVDMVAYGASYAE